MKKPLIKFLLKFAVNAFALFGSVIGLYFFLEQYHLYPALHLIIVLAIGAYWGVKSMLYFRDELSALAVKMLADKKDREKPPR